MIKKLLLLWMLAVSFACSTDAIQEELPEPVQDFDVDLTPSVKEVFLDVPFTVKVQGNEGIRDITRVLDNGVESITSLMSSTALEEERLNLHLGFGFPRNESVLLEFTSITGKKTTKTLNFEVKRGNAVKITGFKINSFYNMEGSWDERFSGTDVNRLADIRFSFRKLRQGHMSNPYPILGSWFLSPVYPNMQQLEWDLSNEGLFILDSSSLELSFIDDEEDGTGQDLTMGFGEISFKIEDYKETKPTEINIRNEDFGFDVTLQVEWF